MVEDTTTNANCHIHVIIAIASETAFCSKADSQQQGRVSAQVSMPFHIITPMIS